MLSLNNQTKLTDNNINKNNNFETLPNSVDSSKSNKSKNKLNKIQHLETHLNLL